MNNKDEVWEKKVRYCGMCRNSPAAQDLYRKAKRGVRLTARQIAAVEWYAGQMVEVVGEENEKVGGEEVKTGFPLTIPSSLTLSSHPISIDRRGDWLVELDGSSVIGRWEKEGGELTIYPNPFVLVSDLKRVICEHNHIQG